MATNYQKILDAYHKTGSTRKAGAKLGIDPRTVARRLRRNGDLKSAQARVPMKGDDSPSLKIVQSDDAIQIITVGSEVRTVEDALKKAEIDTEIWRVKKCTVNSYEISGKARQGQDEDGRWKPEKLWKSRLWQVKVELERIAPKFVQEGIKLLLADMKPPKLPKLRRPKYDEGMLAEVSLPDIHFGKRCWKDETGNDYDLDIAINDFNCVVDELAFRVSGFPVEKVLFPVGNDCFNVNCFAGTTVKGTLVDSTDDRFSRVFKLVCKAMVRAVERLREIADVDILYVPGNHCRESSFYLCEYLDAWFHDDQHVTIDTGQFPRKYRRHGRVLLGFVHGEEEKHQDLPLLMAAERPKDWAETTTRAFHLGHFHRKRETRYNVGDTYAGVSVAVLPSISGTDAWHALRGYVKQPRAAEAYLWGMQGYIGHFSAVSPSQLEEWTNDASNGS